MKVEEARGKYCPLNIIADALGAGENIECDADRCMFWRWKDKEQNDGCCGLAGREGAFCWKI